MAEAEDVIVDAARHATAYAQELLRRRRAANRPPDTTLLDVAPRIDLLLGAIHGRRWQLRAAQPPPPVTALARLFRPRQGPRQRLAIPAADGSAIWLPRLLDGVTAEDAPALYRTMALQQAQRAQCRDMSVLSSLSGRRQRDMYLVLEADAADAAISRSLPGMGPALKTLRALSLQRRIALDRFGSSPTALEAWVRERLASPPADAEMPATHDLVRLATALSGSWADATPDVVLFKDWWTGDFPPPSVASADAVSTAGADDRSGPARSARLARTPDIRQPDADEDDERPGASMVQTAQPHETAADPGGLQRPSDRDDESATEGLAESVSELPEARLVRSSQSALEVLLSDDRPNVVPANLTRISAATSGGIRYPEWDWRRGSYRDPGTTVRESLAEPGPQEWVSAVLESQRAEFAAVRRRFEMLRAERVVLPHQEDGDDIDVDAWIAARADFRAGAPLSQRLYRRTARLRRDSAVMVLVDVSGSTDAWVAGGRRIIDVEREALLALSIALDACDDPYAILAFSGEGAQHVTVRRVKDFDERHGADVALRIAGLQPERYTRAGAALRHASRLLAAQPARHRLLLLLSDGKPNDDDEYEGRYGVEDMRQAVIEARQAGQSPFCLTVDRQAPDYLPQVFGAHQYALLQRPERLSAVLLDWLKRLLAR